MRSYLRTLNGQEYSVGEEWPLIECFRCGICCIGYHPQATVEEIALMAEWLSVSSDEFISKYVTVTQIGYLLRQMENGCIFLTREKDTPGVSCQIYPCRPAACRNLVPNLLRPQCQEGLTRLQIDKKILSVGEIYENRDQAARFCALLTQPQKE